MIAKGNLHAHGTALAAYLLASSEDERAELAELRGFAANNLRDAFIDVQMQSAATKATKPFFHAYVRAPEGEIVAPEIWRAFADRLDQQLGFADQPRAMVFHCSPDGERHMHLAWSRIDTVTMTAIDPGMYKNKMKELCREIEREFGLTAVSNDRAGDVKTKSATRNEFDQSRRLGTDLKAIRNTINDCWQSADSGRAFAAALDQAGLILARGDRRPFVVIDRHGGDHALSKRITGENAPAIRLRMADIDRASLPSVADAKASQLERSEILRRETEPAPRQARKEPAMSDSVTIAPDLDEAQPVAQRDRLIADTVRLADAERVQADMHTARGYRERVEREAEEARKTTQERQQKDSERAAAGDIADAQSRYAQALGSTYSIRDPYGSMANAAMVEYASFHRQQDTLRQAAAAEQNPEKRQLIDLRRQIEGHEYMAITSDRLAGISRAITMTDSASARRDNDMAKSHTALAAEKRQERTDLQRAMQQREKDERSATERGDTRPPRPRSKAEEAMREAAGRFAPSSKEKAAEAARTAQAEQVKQREGLKPDQPTEGAPPTKEARILSATEKAMREAAGSHYQDKATTPRDEGRPQGRPRGGGRGGR